MIGIRNQEVSNEVGNTKPRRGWNVNIGRSICSQDSPRQAKLWFDRKPVQAVGWPYPRVQRAASRHWIYHLFRVLVLRRLQLLLLLTARSCQCGRSIDALGHHIAACARAGVLVAARICREAGGRVATSVFVRDLDLDLHNAGDARRLEVVADGLPLFGGAELAVDTTLVSVLRGDGSARDRGSAKDGVVLAVARRA